MENHTVIEQFVVEFNFKINTFKNIINKKQKEDIIDVLVKIMDIEYEINDTSTIYSNNKKEENSGNNIETITFLSSCYKNTNAIEYDACAYNQENIPIQDIEKWVTIREEQLNPFLY